MSYINMDITIVNQILKNQIQLHLKRILQYQQAE